MFYISILHETFEKCSIFKGLLIININLDKLLKNLLPVAT